nr:DUF2924 domain-containing protein [Nitrosomonas nitrosa]
MSKTAPKTDVERALAALPEMRIEALRRYWIETLGGDPPPCQSGSFLRGLIAWRLQEARFGGLSTESKRRLRKLASGNGADRPGPVSLKPGSMITRAWKGTVHRVHVLDHGFAYQGKRYASLSVIARLVTGKRWSGPRFFGLEAVTSRGRATT